MADETGAAASSPSAAGSSPAPSTVTTPASSTAAPATGAPAAVATQDPARSTEPPRERWDSILDNARTKTRAEVEREFKQKYGWADEFHREPYTFVESWIDQLAQHPQYQQQLLAKAARLLNSRRGSHAQAAPPEEPAADLPYVDGQGNVVGQTYSATQLKQWRDWDWAQREATLADRFAPLEQRAQRQEQAEQIAQLQATASQHSQHTLTELRSQPYFKEHEADIKRAFADHPEWGDNLHRAYLHVLTTRVLPKLSQTEQAKVLDSLQTKAAATTVSPQTQTATSKPKFKSFEEAIRYYEAHPEEAAVMAKR